MSQSDAHCNRPATLGSQRASASECVLIVDDEPTIRNGLRRIVEKAGYDAQEACSVAAARTFLRAGHVDVLVLDLGLPDASGLSLLTDGELSANDVSVIVFTASNAREDMLASVAGGASSYLQKSSDALTIEAQIAAAMARTRARRQSREQRARSESTLAGALAFTDQLPNLLAERFCRAWDLRHVETGAHVRRIGAYSEVVALALGLPSCEAATLGRAAMLHDLGKISIPDAILGKPGKLTAEEFEIMKLHTLEGARLLSGMGHPFLDRAAVIALHHHERWDGSGYPNGLRGQECPLDARIVAVTDVYDALGQARCYKEAWSTERIVGFFRDGAGTSFERPIVEALLASIDRLQELAVELPESSPVATSAVFPIARPVPAFAAG
jgi:response regulator RpfG family c-di-GMP phosphodiesterase